MTVVTLALIVVIGLVWTGIVVLYLGSLALSIGRAIQS